MPRFYFTIHDEWGEATDAEGADVAGLEAAMVRAVSGARSLMSDAVKTGKLDLSSYIEIENQHRVGVARLGFSEALTITVPDLASRSLF